MPYSIPSSKKILTLATAPFLIILAGVLSVCEFANVPGVQGLIQKQKVDTVVPFSPTRLQHKSGVQTYCPLQLFFIFSLLCSHYVALLI